MFMYVIGVSLISAALGGCIAAGRGGILRLALLLLIVSGVVIFLSGYAGLPAWSTFLIWSSAIICLNLSWFAVIIFVNVRGLFVFLREQIFLENK
ncbi:hypothetical protein [Pleomorphomonas koreensis]|uniref:hypothetical protein n=1 Tax=Pleomorphomonas koreensis TaxID=257440 RepID=UPI00047AD5F8|nr:hypothetical protein [Pleomorphomonas koreensis]